MSAFAESGGISGGNVRIPLHHLMHSRVKIRASQIESNSNPSLLLTVVRFQAY